MATTLDAQAARAAMERLNEEAADLHVWLRTQANVPAQQPWFRDAGGTTAVATGDRVVRARRAAGRDARKCRRPEDQNATAVPPAGRAPAATPEPGTAAGVSGGTGPGPGRLAKKASGARRRPSTHRRSPSGRSAARLAGSTRVPPIARR